jgi:two-component system CheB/CheR fusion protein
MTDPNPTASPATLRILVVENHPDTMQALGNYLEGLGHQVTRARSQTEALEMLPSTRCDVMISDIGLPDGNGWELMDRAELPSSVYCVAMSGFGANADRLKSRAAGYRHHLLKPFNPEELDAILEDAASERLATG